MNKNEKHTQNNPSAIRSAISLCLIFAISTAIFNAIGATNSGVIIRTSTVEARQNYIILKEDTVIELYKSDRRLDNVTTGGSTEVIGQDTGERKDDLRASASVSNKVKVFFTSYNPEVGQTDDSPCISATGDNVCEKSKKGIQPLALSRDLIWGTKNGYCLKNCPFKYGDMLKLTSDIPQCNLVGQLMDTMNKRYTMRGDIFYMERSMNTSCEATVTKLSLI